MIHSYVRMFCALRCDGTATTPALGNHGYRRTENGPGRSFLSGLKSLAQSDERPVLRLAHGFLMEDGEDVRSHCFPHLPLMVPSAKPRGPLMELARWAGVAGLQEAQSYLCAL